MRSSFVFWVLLTFTLPGLTAPKPVVINPTVTNFDSIPQVPTDRTFFITLAADTSAGRAATGSVGTTRVHRRKMADIISEPHPETAVKNSIETLLTARGQLAKSPETASHHLRCTVLEFTLRETIKNLSQTMEASVAIEVIVIDATDTTRAVSYIFRSRNSRSMIDTSNSAAAILCGALESALREIYRSITR